MWSKGRPWISTGTEGETEDQHRDRRGDRGSAQGQRGRPRIGTWTEGETADRHRDRRGDRGSAQGLKGRPRIGTGTEGEAEAQRRCLSSQEQINSAMEVPPTGTGEIEPVQGKCANVKEIEPL
ncbi:hypothetical protein chiPu_0002385 [Chiloscyllium punctatum]|uniref:Uncharacterized protein n=1 Tax=Chiloscyllium punctatum TaxID=137246 RepID=A0A401S0S4_CHIPU|nr:hypothetical protein [Chiloscyllium punctatum]